MSYTLIEGGKAIRCDQCRSVSFNHNDIQHRYCGRCRKFHHADVRPVTLTREELIERGYTGVWRMENGSQCLFADDGGDTLRGHDNLCRAEPDDARPSSSDIDYGNSSSSDWGSSSDSGSSGDSGSCGGGD